MKVNSDCYSNSRIFSNGKYKYAESKPKTAFKAASPEILYTLARTGVKEAREYILKREWDSVKVVLNYLRKEYGNDILFKDLLNELIPLIPGATDDVFAKGFKKIGTNLRFQSYRKKNELNVSLQSTATKDFFLTLLDAIPEINHNFFFKTGFGVGEELKLFLRNMGVERPEIILTRNADIAFNKTVAKVVREKQQSVELYELTGDRGFIEVPMGIKLPNEAGKIPEMQEWVNLGTAWRKIITFLDSFSP